MLFCLGRHEATGPVNLTAPTPVTNADLSRVLGRVLKRPAFLPVPGLAVKSLYGEMAEIVITGQRAVPAVLERLGYGFRHPDLEAALRDVLGRPAEVSGRCPARRVAGPGSPAEPPARGPVLASRLAALLA